MSHAGRYIDQEARDLANRGIALIEAHERVCTERARAAADWRENAGLKLDSIETQLGEKITNMGSAIRGVYNRLWVAASGLIVVLLSIIGYLIAHKGL